MMKWRSPRTKTLNRTALWGMKVWATQGTPTVPSWASEKMTDIWKGIFSVTADGKSGLGADLVCVGGEGLDEHGEAEAGVGDLLLHVLEGGLREVDEVGREDAVAGEGAEAKEAVLEGPVAEEADGGKRVHDDGARRAPRLEVGVEVAALAGGVRVAGVVGDEELAHLVDQPVKRPLPLQVRVQVQLEQPAAYQNLSLLNTN